MLCSTVRNGSKGVTYCELLVAIGVIVILMGLGAQGVVWVKHQTETASLTGHANQFSTALQLYYQDHKKFPTAYPSNLAAELGPYVQDSDFFLSRAQPGAGVVPLNNSYVTPVANDPNSYVLSFDSCYDKDQAIVLFANLSVEVVQKVPAYHNLTEIKPGTTVMGGTITTGNGGTYVLGANTTVMYVTSFREADGTPFDVLKVNKGQSGTIAVTTIGTTISEIATEAGVTFLRCGQSQVKLDQADGQDQLTVTAYSGEAVTSAKVVDRGPRDKSVPISGAVNINPNNNDDFEFRMETPPGGPVITRDDLLANRDLDYRGPATEIRFKPKGNGNQNTLIVNENTVYPLRNGTLYTITGTDLTLHLYNDKKGQKGKAMGRWWMNEIRAQHAQIVDADGVSVDGMLGAEYTQGRVFLGSAAPTGGGRRSISHGTLVLKDYWVMGVGN